MNWGGVLLLATWLGAPVVAVLLAYRQGLGRLADAWVMLASFLLGAVGLAAMPLQVCPSLLLKIDKHIGNLLTISAFGGFSDGMILFGYILAVAGIFVGVMLLRWAIAMREDLDRVLNRQADRLAVLVHAGRIA